MTKWLNDYIVSGVCPRSDIFFGVICVLRAEDEAEAMLMFLSSWPGYKNLEVALLRESVMEVLAI